MKNHFCLQLKRIAKILPFVTVLTVALSVGLTAILYGMFVNFSNSEENTNFSIAVTGDTDNEFLKMGMSAMQTFDESRFAVTFKEMSEKDAKRAIEKGNISAYIVIPDNFVENAMMGELDPITFVTSAGTEGLNGLFKKEITALVTDMVINSQKGVYGLYDALQDNNLSKVAQGHMDKLSIEYTELIFKRSNLYTVNELGVSDGLSTPQYYICAILILLLVLIGLPFSAVYIKKDYSFNKLLVSRGYSTAKQIGFEFLAFLIAMFIQIAIIIVAIIVASNLMPTMLNVDLLSLVIGDIILKSIPVVVMLAAFNMMMFELSNNIVSGLLLHFFADVSLCYITGCMYPIYVFPKTIQTVSHFLPTGIARGYLASCFTFEDSFYNLIGLLLYCFAFLGIAWLIRYYKTVKSRG